MNRAIKFGCCLLSVLALSACGQEEASVAPSDAPQSYTLGEGTLLSLNTLVPLGPDYQFEEVTDATGNTVSYVYTQLSDGSLVAQAYARALVKDWECDLQAEGSVDFSHESGQAKLIQNMDGSGHRLYIDIQWDETSCTVKLSLAKTDAEAAPETTAPESEVPETAAPETTTPGSSTPETTAPESTTPEPETGSESPTPTPSGPITLEEAIDYMESLSPSFLGLPGESMEQYIVLCQEGTVYLNNNPCLLLNAYRAEDHKYQHSYLLTVPGLEVYQLDRATGEATALS